MTSTNHGAWDLPPLFAFENIVCRVDNVDATETNFFRALIYNFQINVAQLTPLDVLLASLPRSGWVSQP